MKTGVGLFLVVVCFLCFTAAKNVPLCPTTEVDLQNAVELENDFQLDDIHDEEAGSVVDRIESPTQNQEVMAAIDKENGCCSCSGYCCRCNRLVHVGNPYFYSYVYLTIYGYPRKNRMLVQFYVGSKCYINKYLSVWSPGSHTFKLSHGATFSLEFYRMRRCGRYLYGCARLRFRRCGCQSVYVTLGCFRAINTRELEESPQDPQLHANEEAEMEELPDTSAETKSFQDLSLQNIISVVKKQMQLQGEDLVQEAEENQEGQLL